MRIKKLAFVLPLCAMMACSGEPTDKKIEKLRSARGEWTVDQSDEAVDIYLEGLRKESDLLEQNMEIRRQVEFFSEQKCAREVLDKRRGEIQEARKSLSEKRSRLEKRL